MTLSIIIPTFNEEEIIEKNIKEIRDNLNEVNYEIIVTDDQSSDKTVEIAKKYARVIINSRKGTIGTNRNNGAKIATGKYLAFLDADMFVPEPNKFFKTLIDDFSRNKNLVAATVKIKILPEEATIMDNIVMSVINFLQWLNNNVFRGGGASGEFQMIPRDLFIKVNGYREDLSAG